MKKICVSLIACITAVVMYAQPATVPVGITSRDKSFSNLNTDWSQQITISDVNGRPIKARDIDASGSPFFLDAYKYANIRLVSGRAFANVKSKIDLSEQVVYFVSSNGVEALMESGLVKDITFADTTERGIVSYKFQTGFPAVDRIGTNYFYQVLEEGKCTLLRSIIKKLTEKKNELSGEISKEYESVENFYLFMNGNMKRVKKEKAFFLAELSDKQAELAKYADAEKINFRNTDQLIKLLHYYNSL